MGNQIFIHGGHDGSVWLDDFYIMDLTEVVKMNSDKISWSRPAVHGVLPTPRACHSLTRIGDKLVVFGGYDGRACFNSLFILDLNTFNWSEPKTSGATPTARNAHAACAVSGHKLFIYGGHSGREHLNQLHIFDLNTFSWSTPIVHGDLPGGMRGHSMIWLGDNRIFQFGGYNGERRLNSSWLFDIESSTWQIIYPYGQTPQGRQRHSLNMRVRHARNASEVTCADIFVFGGFDGTQWLDDLSCLSIPLSKSSASAASKALMVNDVSSHAPPQLMYAPPVHQQQQQPMATQQQSLPPMHQFAPAAPPPVLHQNAPPSGVANSSSYHPSSSMQQQQQQKQNALIESQQACLSKYRRLIDDPQFADVILSVDGRELHAHRCILAAQSQHFHQLFTNPQYAAQPGHVIHVKMAGASLEAYAALVEYFYTGSAAEEDLTQGPQAVELLGELYGLARQFEAHGLVKRCEERLVAALDEKASWAVLRIADKQKAPGMRQRALEFILRNYNNVVQNEGFAEMKDYPHLLMEVARMVANTNGH